MTTDERLSALIDRLNEWLPKVDERLDAWEKKRDADNAGLRLELNQLHAQVETFLAVLKNVADNTSAILAAQNELRAGVTDQIQLEVQKQLDAHLPFTTRAAANGIGER